MKPSQIEVNEIEGNPSQVVRECATLYANGHGEDAIRVLRDATALSEPGERMPWLMLLDLYRLKDDVRAFELLAQRYALTFRRPAPHWDVEERDSALPTELRRGGPACCELSHRLDSSVAPRLESLRSAAKNHSIMRFDVRELSSVDPAGCVLLSAELERLVGEGNGIVFAGAERLEQLLREALLIDTTAYACWKLLLDMLQILGRQDDFQSAAIEYGSTLRVAPPSWQTLLLPKIPAPPVEEKRSAPRYQSGSDVFRLSGAMSGAHDTQLAGLTRFATDHPYLNIHLETLMRMDFVCAGHFVSALSVWRQDGKIVRLIRANTLVGALLITLGAHRSGEFISVKAEL